MSHFAVLVIGDIPEEKLAPYSENLDVEPYKEYLDADNIGRMGDYYKISPDDLNSLSKRMKDWSGQKGGVDENGLYHWSTYNPRSKWDWYQLGGRFRGSFILLDGKRGELGEPGVFNNEPNHFWGVDQARMGDIDWEASTKLEPEMLSHLNELWDWVEGKTENAVGIWKREYYIERYGTREQHIEQSRLFITFAVVTEDGEWHEPGRMGWFGISSDSPDEQRDWDNGYWDRFIKDLPPETLLSVFDCHI